MVIFLVGFTSIPDIFAITVPVGIPMGAAAVKNYDPSTVKIEKGDTIKWTVFDKGNNIRHTVTSNSGLFDSGYMTRPPPPNPPPTFTYTFNQGGTYNYHCMVHPWMSGSVIVNESGLNAAVRDCSNLGCVYVDKQRYGVSEGRTVEVKIYGELNNDKGGWAYMLVKDPTGKLSEQKVIVTSAGEFQNPMSISYDKRGMYTVVVTRGDYHPNGSNVGTVTFEVVKLSASQQKDVTPSVMTLSTDLQRYEKGAIIGIAGQLIPYQSGTTDVTIMIRSQNGNVIDVAQVQPSSAGTFSKTFNTLSWSSAGNYEVQAKYENLTKSVTFYLSVPSSSTSSSTSKTSTFLKLDSLDNTFTAQGGPNAKADVTFSGQLLTGDRKSYITDAEIKLVFTEFTFNGKDHYKMTTGDDGKFEWAVTMPIGKGYGVQAVYDGSLSSKFKSSKSQTESFTVMSITPSPPQQPTQSSGGSDLNFMWILIILGVVFAVVAVVIVSKNKKKTPRATPQRKTFGTKQPRKRQITPQPPVGMSSSVDGPSTYGYFECPKCHEPSAPQGKLKQNPDGSQFCSKCGWRS